MTIRHDSTNTRMERWLLQPSMDDLIETCRKAVSIRTHSNGHISVRLYECSLVTFCRKCRMVAYATRLQHALLFDYASWPVSFPDDAGYHRLKKTLASEDVAYFSVRAPDSLVGVH